jgi:hypothetical protein
MLSGRLFNNYHSYKLKSSQCTFSENSIVFSFLKKDMQKGNEQALVIGIVPESKCGYYLGFFKTTKDYRSYQQGRNY